MSPLNSEQKHLLFDYCIGLTSDQEAAEAELLISSNPEAADIHSKLKRGLSPMDSLEPEACPDDLAERTLWRLKGLASSSRERLEQLLASEQTRAFGARPRSWLGLSKRLATAAVFMIAGSLVLASLNVGSAYMRHNSQRQRCQMQQSGIFQGLSSYISDHDGQQPSVAMSEGDPWWKVGAQGSQNHSNTRRVFLLVKEGYVDPGDFVCPGSKHIENRQITREQVETLKDFPGRSYVSYSFQIYCHRAGDSRLLCRKVLMADRNPLFESLPEDFNKPLTLRLDKTLLTINSMNHRRDGQNVLFGDGRVEFLKTRRFDGDDIFTIQDTDIYQGSEVPSCATDFFVAP